MGAGAGNRPGYPTAPAWDAFVQVSGTTFDTLAAVMDQDATEQVMQVNYWAFARIANRTSANPLSHRDLRIMGLLL